jgi:phosphohistidine phosphatase
MLQAGAIPFRIVDDHIEFCLITNSRGNQWIFPKGIIDPGETPAETALKEAYEEAGLRGTIVGPPLGTYEYSKWDTSLQVTVLLMHVSAAEADWPEANCRVRRWASRPEARKLITRATLRKLLDAAWDRLRAESASPADEGRKTSARPQP